MQDGDGRWHTIEHTADLAVEVEATSLAQLFVTAAHALTGVLFGLESGGADGVVESGLVPGSGGIAREMALEAVDREALLVEWLRELLYVSTSNAEGGAWAFVGAEFEELTETRLVGGVELARPPAGREMERELKGVTYHDLEVGRRGGRWRARIVFDV